METEDQRLERLKAERAAENDEKIAKQVAAAKKGGLKGKALELYTKAVSEKQSLTLVPANKVPVEGKDGEQDTGNHLVEVELIDNEPVEFNGMVVVRHK